MVRRKILISHTNNLRGSARERSGVVLDSVRRALRSGLKVEPPFSDFVDASKHRLIVRIPEVRDAEDLVLEAFALIESGISMDEVDPGRKINRAVNRLGFLIDRVIQIFDYIQELALTQADVAWIRENISPEERPMLRAANSGRTRSEICEYLQVKMFQIRLAEKRIIGLIFKGRKIHMRIWGVIRNRLMAILRKDADFRDSICRLANLTELETQAIKSLTADIRSSDSLSRALRKIFEFFMEFRRDLIVKEPELYLRHPDLKAEARALMSVSRLTDLERRATTASYMERVHWREAAAELVVDESAYFKVIRIALAKMQRVLNYTGDDKEEMLEFLLRNPLARSVAERLLDVAGCTDKEKTAIRLRYFEGKTLAGCARNMNRKNVSKTLRDGRNRVLEVVGSPNANTQVRALLRDDRRRKQRDRMLGFLDERERRFIDLDTQGLTWTQKRAALKVAPRTLCNIRESANAKLEVHVPDYDYGTLLRVWPIPKRQRN